MVAGILESDLVLSSKCCAKNVVLSLGAKLDLSYIVFSCLIRLVR